MTRRQVLNITTTKKHDVMRFSNIPAGGSSSTPGAWVTSSDRHSIWCATGRYQEVGNVEFARQRTSIYARGLREVIRFQISDGTEWCWRRVVFSYKGPIYGQEEVGLGPDSATVDRDTDDGVVYYRQFNEPTGSPLESFYDLIFKGEQGIDWQGTYDAKLDRTRVTVLSDVRRSLKSGNSSAHEHTFKLWYPFNKTIVYDDDEIGSSKGSSAFSVQSKAGMGDVYVYDLFRKIGGGGSAMAIGGNSTFYWHER